MCHNPDNHRSIIIDSSQILIVLMVVVPVLRDGHVLFFKKKFLNGKRKVDLSSIREVDFAVQLLGFFGGRGGCQLILEFL